MSQTGSQNIEIERSDGREGLPPHVESYEGKPARKVALRVSVETLDVAWRNKAGLEPSVLRGRNSSNV